MRAIILAAGRGSRMEGLGNARPKCLVELAGKPLLDRQIAALRAGGAQEIGIVRGYRSEMINVPAATYFYNSRWERTNMVMSLAAAAEWLKEGVVVVSYADIFYSGQLVGHLAATAGELAIAYDTDWRALWSRRFADPLADAETFRTDAHGRLLEIGNRAKSVEEIAGQYMGLLKFTPAAWTWVEGLLDALDETTRDRLDMTALLQRLLREGKSITTLATTGQWGEVDNPRDLALYEGMIANGELRLEQ